MAVSLLNRSPTAQNITAEWASLGLAKGAKMAVRQVQKQSNRRES